jgi:hypothetical protein
MDLLGTGNRPGTAGGRQVSADMFILEIDDTIAKIVKETPEDMRVEVLEVARDDLDDRLFRIREKMTHEE